MCFLCCFFGLHDASLVARWLVQSFFVWFRAARERYQVTSSEEASGGEDKKRQQLYRCALPAWSPVSLRPLEVPHTVPVGHGLARWEDYRSSYGQKTSTSHSLYGKSHNETTKNVLRFHADPPHDPPMFLYVVCDVIN